VASGRGQHIDVSMHECAAHIAGYAIPHYSASGAKPARAKRNGEEADLYDPFAVKEPPLCKRWKINSNATGNMPRPDSWSK
jgi:crotonobetainyl-CoA:carnitine CoA-transferase CaiB-like acyl-CoA transferase